MPLNKAEREAINHIVQNPGEYPEITDGMSLATAIVLAHEHLSWTRRSEAMVKRVQSNEALLKKGELPPAEGAEESALDAEKPYNLLGRSGELWDYYLKEQLKKRSETKAEMDQKDMEGDLNAFESNSQTLSNDHLTAYGNLLLKFKERNTEKKYDETPAGFFAWYKKWSKEPEGKKEIDELKRSNLFNITETELKQHQKAVENGENSIMQAFYEHMHDVLGAAEYSSDEEMAEAIEITTEMIDAVMIELSTCISIINSTLDYRGSNLQEYKARLFEKLLMSNEADEKTLDGFAALAFEANQGNNDIGATLREKAKEILTTIAQHIGETIIEDIVDGVLEDYLGIDFSKDQIPKTAYFTGLKNQCTACFRN